MLLSNSDFESLIGDKVSMPYQLRKSDAAARPHVSVHIAQTVRISQGQSSLSLGKIMHIRPLAPSLNVMEYASLGLLHTMVSTRGVLCCNCKCWYIALQTRQIGKTKPVF